MGDWQGARPRGERAGVQSKYDPDFHPQNVIDLMEKEGKTVAQVCAAWDLSRGHYYEWRKRYPEFKIATDIALTKAEAYHDTQSQENIQNPDFNWQIHKHLSGKLFGNAKRAIHASRLNIKEPLKSLESIIKESECGMVDLDEMKKVADLLNSVAELRNNTEVKERLEVLEQMIKERELD